MAYKTKKKKTQLTQYTQILVTVSFGAVLAVIIPAFSPFARAAASSALQYASARAVTAAPLYRFWLGRGWGSHKLRARAGAPFLVM